MGCVWVQKKFNSVPLRWSFCFPSSEAESVLKIFLALLSAKYHHAFADVDFTPKSLLKENDIAILKYSY